MRQLLLATGCGFKAPSAARHAGGNVQNIKQLPFNLTLSREKANNVTFRLQNWVFCILITWKRSKLFQDRHQF